MLGCCTFVHKIPITLSPLNPAVRQLPEIRLPPDSHLSTPLSAVAERRRRINSSAQSEEESSYRRRILPIVVIHELLVDTECVRSNEISISVITNLRQPAEDLSRPRWRRPMTSI